MKNKKAEISKKEFDTVLIFRDIKDKISSKISDMNFDQLKHYLSLTSQEFKDKQKEMKGK